MKPILIAALLLAGTFTKSFARDGDAVAPIVLKAFNATFAGATEVGWSTTEEMYKAVFILNGQHITAYYHADGTMQAATRHISATSLPVTLQTGLKSKYKGQWVSDVLEVTGDDGVHYFATLENADAKTVLKSTATTWSTFQKLAKN